MNNTPNTATTGYIVHAIPKNPLHQPWEATFTNYDETYAAFTTVVAQHSHALVAIVDDDGALRSLRIEADADTDPQVRSAVAELTNHLLEAAALR